ncbi:hypothetical protein [Cohnella phaseoli]|uniref:Uncharacterized protein n=1 Tax=Cohnella phaseoli TaxID=456490 RepID=A0A3D9JQ31_9BACL|nr:hypothetical protein [Cohnella phaseoli]RED76128.1 hypothetical protein DFP98_113189 [Cohnella phaseoli]
MSDKHPGGRPRQGITKKVSLTLTEEEWSKLEGFSNVAAFIKEQLNPVPIFPSDPSVNNLGNLNSIDWYDMSKAAVEYRFNTTVKYGLEKDHPYTAEMIADVKNSIFRSLFPKDAEVVTIETKTQYICPFTNKRFGSIDKLVENAVPLLLRWKLAKVQRQDQIK